jgi:hypothetical protein
LIPLIGLELYSYAGLRMDNITVIPSQRSRSNEIIGERNIFPRIDLSGRLSYKQSNPGYRGNIHKAAAGEG